MRKHIPEQAYKIYVGKRSVVAKLQYHGKELSGKAVCHEHDSMDMTAGKEIAIARCEVKLRHARTVHARKELRKIQAQIRNLQDRAAAYEARIERRIEEEQDAIQNRVAVENKYH